MINDILKDADLRMHKTLEAMKQEFAKLRTGRAHPSLLDQVMVSYYNVDTPLKQLANITVSDARTLTVSPWEKAIVSTIDKAIRMAGLGLNPVVSSDVIRVPVPALTEERRRDLIRVVKAEAENARVAIRNVRRDANADLKELLKAKDISEDDEHRAQEQVQKITDKMVAHIDTLVLEKEKEMMEI